MLLQQRIIKERANSLLARADGRRAANRELREQVDKLRLQRRQHSTHLVHVRERLAFLEREVPVLLEKTNAAIVDSEKVQAKVTQVYQDAMSVRSQQLHILEQSTAEIVQVIAAPPRHATPRHAPPAPARPSSRRPTAPRRPCRRRSTGGCVGGNNYRFFLLFVGHCYAGMGYACYLSWWPFRDCVLRQCSLPSLGLVRSPPPDDAACTRMGARSLVLLPCAALLASLGCLGALHALLLANGLTTAQYVRRWRARGWRSLSDLLLVHGEAETDKWALLWGRSAPTLGRRLRVLMLPSLPESRRLGAGVGAWQHWAAVAALGGALLWLAPLAASALETVAGRMSAAG